ncbi:MAG: TetR family transcriptional regulator [Pseudonocardiaceae bacterium]|nr:TetR family transcriptional regulator [Pseudonocardiaceae bacterium]
MVTHRGSQLQCLNRTAKFLYILSKTGEGARSFIHVARQQQLVECAVEVIAEQGLAGASTVRIAERAGVSRGVLTYHFRDRAELIEKVVASVYDLGSELIGPEVATAASPRDALLTFISGSIDLYARYPKHLTALTEIFAAGRTGEGAVRSEHARHTQELSDLVQILRAGQEQGQFREFNVEIMCTTIRRALDGALEHIVKGAPAEQYTAELQTIVDAATRAEVDP